MRKVLFMILVSVSVLLVALATTAQDEKQSVQSGVYSEEQAARGEKTFSEACLVCHQPEEFRQGNYMEGWSGQTVGDFVGFIRSTMPEDNPGRLKRREYIDIVSFFFQQNGLPAGDADLERDALGDIVIEGPFGTGGNDR